MLIKECRGFVFMKARGNTCRLGQWQLHSKGLEHFSFCSLNVINIRKSHVICWLSSQKIHLGTYILIFMCNNVYTLRQFTDTLKHFQEFHIKDPCPIDFMHFSFNIYFLNDYYVPDMVPAFIQSALYWVCGCMVEN